MTTPDAVAPGARPAYRASHADKGEVVTDPNWHTCAVCGVRWQRFHECPSAPRSTSAPGFAGPPWSPPTTAAPITVGRLRQLLAAFHDDTQVWISEDNLLHRVEVDAKQTAAGYGVVLHRGDRVTW